MAQGISEQERGREMGSGGGGRTRNVSRRSLLILLGLPGVALGLGQTACSRLAAASGEPGQLSAGAARAVERTAAVARQAPDDLLAVTCARGRHLAVLDPASGTFELVEVGAAPHGLALHPDGRAFVATAEGVAVVDIQQRQRLALAPYSVDVGAPRVGEYRPGGMGIAVTPDGRRVAVAVYTSGGPSTLDVLDAASLQLVRSVKVGVRPFQVVAAPDSREAFSIDHDSYTVTAVDLDAGTVRQLPAMPLGRGVYDKPHYAVQRSDGRLLLPYQGRVLQLLDPVTGGETTMPLSAQTHQHGVALTPDERTLVIVGTGPAGEVSGPPSLTLLDLATGREEIVPLAGPHERVTLSRDGKRAYLTGGYLLTGGWDGLTVVDLEMRTTREVALPDGPLEAALLG